MTKLHIRLLPLFLIVTFVIIIGTLFYSLFENWNYVDSLYFTVTTLTTIGYGDLHPTNDATKLFTVAYVLSGVYMVLYALRIITTHYMEHRTPSVKGAVTRTLENMIHRRKHAGDVVLKVEEEKVKSTHVAKAKVK